MNRDIFKSAIYLVPALAIQLSLFNFITFEGIKPDLLIILITFFSLRNGQLYGIIIGFLYGAVADLFGGGVIGTSMFAYTLSGFIIGFFYNENKIANHTTEVNFLFFVSFAAGLSSFIFNLFEVNRVYVNMMNLLLVQGIIPGIYTAVIAIPFMILNFRKGIE